MPRKLDEILEHADELAKRFEELEPDPSKMMDAAPLRDLIRAVENRAEAERAVAEAVAAARAKGFAWSMIGMYLGTSGEAARQRYGRHASS